ncbi:hypothetical protein Tsubulata_033245 [Turnera subulata]|uniref:RING-type domain-containing protein n=1 Tax=Turnera subulata TaxID=218843 RepID=A0A9Q0J7M0_9ROSI|nr:hypothetical protein Tsubulata_033245 [Turnera subulata]
MAANKPVKNLFSYVYSKTILFFELFFFQVVVLIRCAVPGSIIVSSAKLFRIITTQYLNLIEEENPTFCYSQKWRRQQQQQQCMDCAVCLSEFLEGERVRRLHSCRHIFHKECLDKWLQYMATCPVCRAKVLPDEIVSNYQQLQNEIVNGATKGYDDIIFLLSALYGDSLRRFF